MIGGKVGPLPGLCHTKAHTVFEAVTQRLNKKVREHRLRLQRPAFSPGKDNVLARIKSASSI